MVTPVSAVAGGEAVGAGGQTGGPAPPARQ